jgi:hypothetical protein
MEQQRRAVPAQRSSDRSSEAVGGAGDQDGLLLDGAHARNISIAFPTIR